MSTHPLPALYARWMADALPGPAPDEPTATCDACAMCVKPDGTVPTATVFFDPAVKCCVYMPRLPNFLVGRILDGEGAASVRARIVAGVGVGPLFLDRPATYDLVHLGSVNTLGRSHSLRCPHFVEEGGRCGIWTSRDALCSTWFCRHERGAVGAAYWTAVRDLLTAVERALALWAAREEGISAEVLAQSLPPSPHDRSPAPRPDGAAVDGEVDEAVARFLWGRWRGQEEAYYRACAARVAALAWADVLRIGGPEVAVLADVAVSRRATLDATSLPGRLEVGRFSVIARRTEGVRAVTYSSLDAIDLPAALLGLLPAFDGRPVDAVLAELKANWNVEIDASYLRRLVDWGVLVPVR